MKVYVVFVATDETYYCEIENQTNIFRTKEEAERFKDEIIAGYIDSRKDIDLGYGTSNEKYCFISDKCQQNFIEVTTFEKEI